MLSEKKYVRAVIRGCTEQGVHVSEELATVFVSVYICTFHIEHGPR